LNPVDFTLTTGNLIIDDGRICNIISSFDKNINVDDIIPADNYIVFPGLINAHVHPSKILYQGLYPRGVLSDILDLVHKNNKKETEEQQFYSSLCCLLNHLKHGVTTFGIFTSRPREDIRAVNTLNVRANICFSQNDTWNGEGTSPYITNIDDILHNYNMISGLYETNRVVVSPATSSELTASDRLISLYSEIAKEKKCKFFMHIHEGKDTVERYTIKNGNSAIEHLYRNKLISDMTCLIHSTSLSTLEKNMLYESRASLIHCPSSNLFVNSGQMDLGYFSSKNVVSLGTDAAMINPVDSLTFEALLAYNTIYNFDFDTQISAKKLLKMLTVDGARTLGLNKLGLIDIGFIADLIFFDKRDFTYPYVNTPLSLLTMLHRETPSKIMLDGCFLDFNTIKNSSPVLSKMFKYLNATRHI
ncbi:amidohydrolase family protein, partial [Salmonella enterica]|nr:amidohydrolase family protein [Salmonella enterica]